MQGPSKPTARRSTRERSRVNLAEPDSEGEDGSLVDDSDFEGDEASSEGDEAIEEQVAALPSDADDDFREAAPCRCRHAPYLAHQHDIFSAKALDCFVQGLALGTYSCRHCDCPR